MINPEGAHGGKQPAESSIEGRTPVPAYSWYVLVVLTLVFLLASVDRSLMSVVVEPIRHEFDLTDSQMGFLAGLAFGIPFALASLPFGLLIDRINRRTFLACAIAIWSGLTAVCGFAQSFVHLLMARMIVGVAESGFPAAQSMITDYFPLKRRPMALGVFFSGGSIAFVLTFALGGFVAQEWGWRAVFWMAGPPGILLSLLLFLTIREPGREGEGAAQAPKEPPPPLLETLRYLFSLRAFLHLFIGYAIVAATNASFWTWIGSLLIRVHGLGVRDAGLLIAVGAGGCGFIGAILGAAFCGRIGKSGMKPVLAFIAIASAGLAPLGVAMALSPSLIGALVFMVLVSIVKSSYAGPAQGIILSLAKTRMRGVAASLLNIAGTLLGFGVGPFISGTISHLLGGGNAIRYGIACLFLMNIWAGLHFWAARKTVEADVEAGKPKAA
jgi:predicted MFS family arabinose efflux permease